jgi:Barrel-sandwich domain of CusB or HlyD membrane-fusion
VSSGPAAGRPGQQPPIETGAPRVATVTTIPPHQNEDQKMVALLLRVEGEARGVKSVGELAILIANETRKFTRARQIFVVAKSGRGAFQVEAVTALTKVDRDVPLIQWIERTVARLSADVGLSEVREFVLHAYGEPKDPTAVTYPLREAMWVPLKDRAGQVFAGFLMVREEPWKPNDMSISLRLSVTYAQAWYWLVTSRSVRPAFQIDRRRVVIGTAAALVLLLLPVHLTTLAPMEVGARDQTLVTAAIDGVIEDIPVAANSAVGAGQSLVRFADTTLRNKLAVAEREVQVGDARVKKTMLLAVNDIRGRQELAVAQGELTVKIAERDYARDLLERGHITAPKAGIVMFGEKRDLIGKPVTVGEKIMEIADPARVEIRIDVPVGDAIILGREARAKIFLDSDPLNPLEARVLRSDYQAKQRETGVLVFRVIAEFVDGQGVPPRLGIRGTAQLYGDRVPLVYVVLRRPIAALRQWTGL